MKHNGGGVAAIIADLHSAKMTLKNVSVPKQESQ